MRKLSSFLLIVMGGLVACDLQPKITALPDTVGDFITARYPALLADPTTQPEIYNSAATDYGVYAAPELYGTGVTTDDYVLYASVDDYIVPPDEMPEAPVEEPAADETVVAPEQPNVDDTLVVGDRVANEPVKEEAKVESEPDIPWTPTDDVLNIPKYMYGGHDETEITVARGDTLYAIGAKYGMKVDEIAKLNNLSEPYNLSVGQKLVVRASREQVVTEIPKIPEVKPEAKPIEKPAEIKPVAKEEPKPVVKEEPKPVAKEEPKPVAKEAPKPAAKETPKQTPPARATTTRVDVTEVKIAPGDTLYSLSRQYSVPVNDLAVMNNLTAPFALYAGQIVRVPNLATAPVRAATTTPAKAATTATKPTTTTTKSETTNVKPKQTETKKAEPKKTETAKKQTETKKANDKKSSNAVKKLPAIAARSSSKFSWPVRGKILSNYGAKNGGLFNDGINIGATRGTSVAAAENGVVAYAGNEVKGMGNLIIVQHSDGWMTVYAHMDSLAVRRGARVNVGQKIGTVGQTGKVDKPQLHFEVRKGTKAYNPIQYLKK
ncbi:MAG: peptidoglycan DD-metalloendopeptidase family protein [Alphaproteobacteria bacterium]|nr:peptidoglycan DD-metalloendopeptidase family protein [Alphaproteobacteria bacterium]